MTDLIFFCTSLLLISTLLVIFLLRSSIFNKKVLIISISNEVIVFLERKLDENPKDIDAWLVLARTCLITGHIQKSELYYFKALKYFP